MAPAPDTHPLLGAVFWVVLGAVALGVLALALSVLVACARLLLGAVVLVVGCLGRLLRHVIGEPATGRPAQHPERPHQPAHHAAGRPISWWVWYAIGHHRLEHAREAGFRDTDGDGVPDDCDPAPYDPYLCDPGGASAPWDQGDADRYGYGDGDGNGCAT